MNSASAHDPLVSVSEFLLFRPKLAFLLFSTYDIIYSLQITLKISFVTLLKLGLYMYLF